MEDVYSEFLDLLQKVVDSIANKDTKDAFDKLGYELFTFLEKAKNDGYDITKLKEIDLKPEFKEDNDNQKWFKEIKEIVSGIIDIFESNCK